MALSDSSRAAIAFKKVSGFINSSNGTSFFSEKVRSQIAVHTGEILGKEIPTNPNNLSDKKKIDFELVENNQLGYQDDKGYDLAIPGGTVIDFPSGSVEVDSGASKGNRLLRSFQTVNNGIQSAQIIPQKYNLSDDVDNGGYGYIFLRDPNASPPDRIFRASGEQWQLDPVAGSIVAAETLNIDPSVSTLTAYLYTGPTARQLISDAASSGSSGTTGLQDNQGPGIVIYDENASTGEKSLAYDATEVIQNSAVDYTGGNVTSSANGIHTTTDTGSGDSVYNVTHSIDHGALANKDPDANNVNVTGYYIQKGSGSNDTVTETAHGNYTFKNGTFTAGSGNLTVTSSNVNFSASNVTLSNNGTMQITGNLNVGGTGYSSFSSTGEVRATDFTETSSMRYKDNIRSAGLGDVVDAAASLDPKSYDIGDRNQIGLIAERVAEQIPELVSFYDGKPDSLNYGRLASVFAVEIAKENRRLRGRVEALEEKLS